MKALIYTRLSLDREGETSTERQEADCRAYCAAKGWEVVEVLRDRLSGYKDVRRPGYEKFMAALADGSVDVGVIWKLDRLTRKGIKDIAPLLEALRSGKSALASVNDSIDTSTAMGEGVLGLLASIAMQESQNISLRTTSAKAAQARAGKPVINGIRAFGYALDRVTPVPEEAELLRTAARQVLTGRAMYDIAREWELAGVRGPSWTRRTGEEVPGTVMAGETIRRILLSPRLVGLREYKGERYPAVWPAILDLGDWEALCLLLGTRKGHKRVRSYLLTGGIFCGTCGGTLTPRTKAAKDGYARQYQCVRMPGRARNCGRVKVTSDRVEEWAVRVVLAGMTDLEVLAAPPSGAGAGVGALLEEMRTLQTRLGALEDAHYVEGTLPADRFRELREGISARLGVLGASLGGKTALSAASDLARAVDPAAAWEAWSLEERRKFVQAWWPRLEVSPALRTAAGGAGRTFQPGRLRFVDPDGAGWRIVEGETGPELRPEAAGDRRFLRL